MDLPETTPLANSVSATVAAFGRPSTRFATVFIALLGSMCSRSPSAGTESESRAAPLASATPSANAPQEPSAAPAKAPDPEPEVVLRLPVSAYHVSLQFDGEALYVLAPRAAYRIVQGEPLREYRLELGFAAAAMRSSFLYWSKDGIYKTPKQGGRAQRLVPLAEQPQNVLTSGDDFAWISAADDKRLIQSAERGKARTAYSSNGSIDVATMLNDWVFFVERPEGKDWRIGSVRASGGEPTFTAPKTGPYPAMLFAWKDIYYYEPGPHDLYRLSPDLRHEERLAQNFVCSPLAVWEKVYCAQVQGLWEVSEEGPRRLLENKAGLIATIAAGATRIAWVNDTGADQLAVSMIAR